MKFPDEMERCWFPNVPGRRKEASLWDRLSSLICSETVGLMGGAPMPLFGSEKISADQRFSFLLGAGFHRLALLNPFGGLKAKNLTPALHYVGVRVSQNLSYEETKISGGDRGS